ncbi:MAG: hypothetical protein KKI12_08000 [Proteobacteria bacterium]|nr:hypothetical protein [Pseudomonadota bacterium]MBU4510575.1 hypothetical protein [bacterium]
METQATKTNWFVRILIIVFCLGLFVMVFYNFLFVDPKGEINSGLLILLSISLILVLAESFDSFSIGKLISISRETKKKEKQIQGLEKKNSELINQIISIQNIQSQTQQHTNVYGDYNIGQKSEQVAGQESEPEVDRKAVEKLLAVIGESIVISELETRIIDEMKANNLKVDGDSIKVLVKHLAGTQLLLAFERIHSIIFGSQIFLLKRLNESAGVGKPMVFVEQHIDHVRNMFSENLSSWTNEQYLQFLFDRILIVRNDEQLHVTNLGVEYLTWLVRNGRSDNKPL